MSIRDTYLVDDDAMARDVLFSECLKQAGGLIDAQHGGDGGYHELGRLLVPEQVAHHDHALLHTNQHTVTKGQNLVSQKPCRGWSKLVLGSLRSLRVSVPANMLGA